MENRFRDRFHPVNVKKILLNRQIHVLELILVKRKIHIVNWNVHTTATLEDAGPLDLAGCNF